MHGAREGQKSHYCVLVGDTLSWNKKKNADSSDAHIILSRVKNGILFLTKQQAIEIKAEVLCRGK